MVVSKVDVPRVRKDFPVLMREVRPGTPLIYFDSAATSQKPTQVIQAMDRYYQTYNANIHRGVHTLAEEATAAYELAREKIGQFIGADHSSEIIYTRNTTEAINLTAQTWGKANLKKGDVVILTEMEHHSNLVPWQMLASASGVRLEFIPITPEGYLNLEEYEALLKLEPKLVSFTHMSNVLGTINPVKQITTMAHQAGAVVLLDGAQAVPHFPVNVKELGVDFMAFSAHKMCGPTGIGVLYGLEKLLTEMPPFLGGGDMIRKVYLRSFTPNELPHKFEAGTPAIAEAIGFGEAVDYLEKIGLGEISDQEQILITYAMDRLSEIPGVEIYGPPAKDRGGVLAFSMKGIHPHDVAQILDRDGIAIRAGHHCAMPLHDILKVNATSRASLYLYNTSEEIDKMVTALYKVKDIFGE